jgi:methanogenic corrinoid protein MtbC1
MQWVMKLRDMIHVQVSVKLDEDTYAEIARLAAQMGITVHKFIVDALGQVLHMIGKRGQEKIPLLVIQARIAVDYAQAAPVLPVCLEIVTKK